MDDLTFNSAINYLHDRLTPKGFGSFSSSTQNFLHPQKCQTNFSDALILDCLNSLDQSVYSSEKLSQIKQQLADCLLSQKTPQGSFNYWLKDSVQAKNFPLPDDLDDTFCALSALSNFDSRLIDGKVLAGCLAILTGVETKPGGPYRTWLTNDPDLVWQDIDLVVNSNVAYFLKLHEVVLDNLVNLVDVAIRRDKYDSAYYPDPIPVLYMVTRGYQGQNKHGLVKKIISLKNARGIWSNPLYTAMASTSLQRLSTDFNSDQIQAYLKKTLSTPTKVRAYPICFDQSLNQKRRFLGSPYLTIAFCLEALALNYQSRLSPQKHQVIFNQSRAKKVSESVIGQVQTKIQKMPPNLKRLAVKNLEQTLDLDKDQQIVLMPYLFGLSLKSQYQDIDTDFLVNLGSANVFGWMAYTIYDDFLDNEGLPQWLSLANFHLRQLCHIYENIFLLDEGFKPVFHSTMDEIDEANSWEVLNCRFDPISPIRLNQLKLPSYGRYRVLSSKSIGHFLGPLAILLKHQFKANSKQTKVFMDFFRSCLIARQLNDDAHDWQEDLKKGHLNAVASLVIQKALTKKMGNQTLLNKQTLENLDKVFWSEAASEINQIILDHTDLAQKALLKSAVLGSTEILSQLLNKSRTAAQMAISQQQKVKEFLSVYHG